MSGKNDKKHRIGFRVFGRKNSNNQSANESAPSSGALQNVLEVKTYLANPKAYVYIHNMSMASRLLTVKLDHHLQYKETHIPIVDGRVNWNTLEKYNGRFQEMRIEVEELQNMHISDHSLNIIAQRVVDFVTKQHALKSMSQPAIVD